MSTSYPDAHPWKEVDPRPSYAPTQLEAVLQRLARYTQASVIAAVLLLTLAALALPARAQTKVTGRVLDGDGAPVAYANVQLLVFSDSSFAKGTIADEEGHFTLEAVKPGAYRLFVSLIGYQDYLSDVLTFAGGGERRDIPVTLLQRAIDLEGVTVEARRTLYEQQGDRLVINVGTSVTLSGATALDVLKRSPGVIVNEQSNAISMLGKEGVRVMIGGKLSYIPAEGLVQYLAGLSADNIESIELITSPPANLDAEGNAGFINIVLRRNPDDGLSGSVTISGGYGEGELGSASADFNYQRNRISLYGSSSFLWSGQKQFATNFRRVVGAEGIMEMPTVTWRDPVWRHPSARVGIDYQLSGKTTVGALVAAFDNRWSMNALNRLTVKTDGRPVTRIESDNEEINHWRHVMGNLNVRHKLSSAGTFSMDLDYLYYHDNNPTGYLNTSTEIANGVTTEEQLQSGKVTPFRILVAKADYLTVAREKWELGAGVKGAFSRFTNETSFASLIQGEWVARAGLGSTSNLREDVFAVYGHANVRVSASVSLKAGLRYELTDSNLGSDEEEDLVDRRFGSLFPSVTYTHKLSDAHQIGVSYTRRITRPSFHDMAPFLYLWDPYTFFTGNAALQPAITSSLKLDVTFKTLLASLEYAWEDSTIARFQNHFIPEDDLQLIFPVNLRGTRTTTALITLPVQLTDWWSTQNDVMVTWQAVDGFMRDVPVTMNREFVRFNMAQNLRLPHGFAFETTGFYQSATLSGITQSEPMWGVDLGLQRALPGGKGKLTLSVSDVFNSVEWRSATGSPDDPLYIKQLYDTSRRTFQLTYTRRFGGSKAMTKRSTASEEESERVQ